MAIERPTFHESWYRVADLRPRLLSSVKVYRQHFRGKMWYVLENSSNNSFSRISSDAYNFIGLLDGKRTVDQVWQICNERFGDMAPTQPEVIQLLGHLYCSNLLYAELAPDCASLFNRYQSRIKRQIHGVMANLLFIKIPVFDPDHFLNRWLNVFGWFFSWIGFILWLAVISAGLYFVIGNYSELFSQTRDILNPANFIYLYISVIIIKICHEFGHAFSCKRFGRFNGSGGEVHIMGIMFLIFVPLPFVDASSAWAFRKKWHRAIVGMSGVMVELFCAAIAVFIWVNTSSGTLHIIAYNIIFIASISTLLFNANPLLRFDAYYVLSDLIEIPNLGQRAKNYIYYIVKRYCWGLKTALNPAQSLGEVIWFFFYGIASTIYRIFIAVRILLFLNSRLPEELFILVPIFAASAILAWLVVPVLVFVRYLATSNELSRNRFRAVSSTIAGLALLFVSVGIVRVPEYFRIEGIVEPVNLAVVYAENDGFITDYLPSGQKVSEGENELIKAVNPKLEANKKGLLAELASLKARQRLEETRDKTAAQILDKQIDVIKEKIAKIDSDLSSLTIKAPLSGTWFSPDIEKTKGLYLKRGQKTGIVADMNDLRIRATAGQKLAELLFDQAGRQVEMKVRGRPKVELPGKITEIFPAGQKVLPSQALGYAVGGFVPIDSNDPKGMTAAENFFEVRVHPEDGSVRLFAGQRVIVRIEMPPKPLVFQLWRSARQLFQRRFNI
jgi:putative peptide zinc metalloprotease protein